MERLLHAGLSNAVSATVLAVLVACLGRVLARRPAILHCLWLLVLLKLVTPPLYQVPIPWPESFSAREETAVALEPGEVAATFELLQFDPDDLRERSGSNEPYEEAAALDLEAAIAPTDAALIARAAIVRGFGWFSLHWVPIVGSLWLAGTLATVLISLRRIYRFQIVLREATPGSDQIQGWVDELSASLGMEHSPQVWWISGKLSPMLWAVGACPRLILPIELWKGLDERQRGTLLVHELAHLKRGDHRVRIFELAVTALYWWNPVLWWARQALRDVEEQCCDAWVVWAFPEAAKSYAETLLETLDFLNHSELSEPLLASGFGKVQHLRRRLTMIMSGTTPRLLGLRGTLAALSLGAVLLPINASWAQKPDEQKEIQVIVKTDDGKDNVIISDCDLNTEFAYVVADEPGKQELSTVVFSAEPLKTVRDTLILSDEPNKLETRAVLLQDKVTSDGKPDVKSEVKVFVTADDSTVTITADSLEDALKKITEQVKALKANASHGGKDKQKAYSQLAEQLEQLLKSQKAAGESSSARAGAGKGKDAITQRFVVRRMDDVKTETASPEKKAEIDGLRKEVKKLSGALAEAQRKLAQLEGRTGSMKTVRYFSVPDKTESKVERQTAIVRVPEKLNLKTYVTPFAKVEGVVTRIEPDVRVRKVEIDRAGKGSKADEDRIGALEKKLNKVIEALENMKKSKGD